MAGSTRNRIIVKTASAHGDVARHEALAGEAGIGPGDLLEHTTGGAVLRHNGAAGAIIPKMVALETQHPDDEDDITIDVDYANGDKLYYAVLQPGDQVQMWLASGENASVNDVLESDGDGALTVGPTLDATVVLESIVGRAVEAVNATAAISRILVEIT